MHACEQARQLSKLHTHKPPPRCSLPAARRPASLSLPCDDFHTALATLAHRRRLPHAVAQHYAVPPLAVPPPCSHHCAQARQPRCLVTRIVNSAVISATPRCTPTPASLLPLQRRHRLSYKLAAVRDDAERPQPQSPGLKAPPAELDLSAYKRHPRPPSTTIPSSPNHLTTPLVFLLALIPPPLFFPQEQTSH